MDAIIFSANPNMVKVDDAIRHLSNHDELYWEVGFPVVRDRFEYPMLGFIHIKGGQVEYKVTIKDIIPFSTEHYEGQPLSEMVKPKPWLKEWEHNLNGTRSRPWKTAIVITDIEPFSYDTYKLLKYDGKPITLPPQGYIKVLPPEKTERPAARLTPGNYHRLNKSLPAQKGKRYQLLEENLEEFVIQSLDEIEPGLSLLERQLSTPAGRLDLLCKDREGQYVVVELKRAQGTDQVVGQILRYMGWVKDHYHTDKFRGIIIVGSKDRALSYAIKAAPNVQVKEFRLSIK